MYQSRAYSTPAGDPAWDNLKTGTGLRQFSVSINFPDPFGKAPEVQVFIAGFDIENSANPRLRVKAANTLPDKFDLVIETWADSKVWAVDVVWIAHD